MKWWAEFYLENRPLNKAFISTCGLGIIPALRYRKSILLYLYKNNIYIHSWHFRCWNHRVKKTRSFKSCISYLDWTSCAAVSTDCTEPTSRCTTSTRASGWEVRRVERAAWARCMFLQARQSRSWLSTVSSLSHKARPMPLQTETDNHHTFLRPNQWLSKSTANHRGLCYSKNIVK